VYASFARRVVAFVIDYVLIWFVIGLVSAFAAANNGPPQGGNNLAPLLMLLLVWLYKAGMESSRLQATVGKLALGIKVTTLAGERIGFRRATGRSFAQILSAIILYVGFLMAGFTKRRQALHDMIAGTLVVQKKYTSEEIANSSPASAGDDVVAVVLIVFGGIALVGILAAIAIPAYQNYTIRAQVTEGLSLADELKLKVAEFYENTGTFDVKVYPTLWTADAIGGKYANPITVDDHGNILITYEGVLANNKIKGLVLYLQPGTDGQGDVVWVCGKAAVPPNVTLSHAATTTVPAQYLPSACHS
jgi:uncharacterized RDD family membrane protein YckC/Tfp pilus assembly major pilin PilA